MSRLPLWRKITWRDLAPKGAVPEDCIWPLPLVLARLRDDRKTWPARYLAAFPGEREVLGVYLACIVADRSFVAACNRRQWSRATAYRFIDRGLRIIALGLARDTVSMKDLCGTDPASQAAEPSISRIKCDPEPRKHAPGLALLETGDRRQVVNGTTN